MPRYHLLRYTHLVSLSPKSTLTAKLWPPITPLFFIQIIWFKNPFHLFFHKKTKYEIYFIIRHKLMPSELFFRNRYLPWLVSCRLTPSSASLSDNTHTQSTHSHTHAAPYFLFSAVVAGEGHRTTLRHPLPANTWVPNSNKSVHSLFTTPINSITNQQSKPQIPNIYHEP